MKSSKKSTDLSRRQFFKISGAASAGLGSVGLGIFGYESGKDPQSYTGWNVFEGSEQTFPRERFEIDKPHYEKVGPTSRLDARTGVIFMRSGKLMQQWRDNTGVEGLESYLRDFYKANPELLQEDLRLMQEIFPKWRQDQKQYGDQFILSNAWSHAMGAVSPPRSTRAPEEADFPKNRRTGETMQPLKMKSPEKTSKLIKKIAHELGSTLVGITKLNPDWVYLYPMHGRGFAPDEPIEVPKHWQYAIVVGTPMSWDPFYANPNYGTSEDAYSISRIIAHRLVAFIHQLGYAARAHTPGASYDLMVPPILVDAGIGEQGRHSVIITPELGCNFRPAIVTTNLPLHPDKPIEFGVQDFCKTCKICAEQCPSNAISKGDKVVVRGYRRYTINTSKCYNFWYSNLGNLGCRICLAVCPYTRKANWLHKAALQITANDPTSLSHSMLTALQKQFYPAPEPQDYFIPSMGGKNASYRAAPWWLKTEDFIDF